jgi:hypothetical protein
MLEYRLFYTAGDELKEERIDVEACLRSDQLALDAAVAFCKKTQVNAVALRRVCFAEAIADKTAFDILLNTPKAA